MSAACAPIGGVCGKPEPSVTTDRNKPVGISVRKPNASLGDRVSYIIDPEHFQYPFPE
jgi:hypothetical protein